MLKVSRFELEGSGFGESKLSSRHIMISTQISRWLHAHIRGFSGRVLDWRPRGPRFESHWCHCVVSLSKKINPSLVLVQPSKTRPYITERLLMGRKESNKQTYGL